MPANNKSWRREPVAVLDSAVAARYHDAVRQVQRQVALVEAAQALLAQAEAIATELDTARAAMWDGICVAYNLDRGIEYVVEAGGRVFEPKLTIQAPH